MNQKSEGEVRGNGCQLLSELKTDEAALIWDEYKYRHEHCWKTIFKLTSAAVLLGVVPYLDSKLPTTFDLWLIAPPVLAVILIGFGMLRMVKELSLLRNVKRLHRERQDFLYGPPVNCGLGSFEQHVWFYLGFLLVLASANVVIAVLLIRFRHATAI